MRYTLLPPRKRLDDFTQADVEAEGELLEAGAFFDTENFDLHLPDVDVAAIRVGAPLHSEDFVPVLVVDREGDALRMEMRASDAAALFADFPPEA